MTSKAKNSVITYFQESFQELKKVTWPTRNQAIRMTFIVLGFCLIAAAVTGALDFVFNFGYRSLVNYASKVTPPAITTPVDATSTEATAPTTTETTTTPITITPGSSQQ